MSSTDERDEKMKTAAKARDCKKKEIEKNTHTKMIKVTEDKDLNVISQQTSCNSTVSKGRTRSQHWKTSTPMWCEQSWPASGCSLMAPMTWTELSKLL